MRDIFGLIRPRCLSLIVFGISVGFVATANGPAPGAPALSVPVARAQSVAGVTVTGVAPNHSSARIYYQPVSGAQDYRVLDLTSPTNVKYAGLQHLTASASCPGPSCAHHFVTQADGVTPLFPYQIASGGGSGPKVLDVPATDIEWNSLGDGQLHQLVVEAVDQLGPAPQANLYMGRDNAPVVNPMPTGAMLGSNKGATNDGNVSTNGQGPYTNSPQVIAQSSPFVVQARQDLHTIPSRASATQQFFDTFENSENATIQQISRQDSGTDSVGNLGSMTFSMNAGTPKEWTIEYRRAGNTNSMPVVGGDPLQVKLFDVATAGASTATPPTYPPPYWTPSQHIYTY